MKKKLSLLLFSVLIVFSVQLPVTSVDADPGQIKPLSHGFGFG
ncbi:MULTISPECIES: hypothetical protein [Paenibacillus]|nr:MULTISPECIES: hypothetical protein [Paenibacillus]